MKVNRSHSRNLAHRPLARPALGRLALSWLALGCFALSRLALSWLARASLAVSRAERGKDDDREQRPERGRDAGHRPGVRRSFRSGGERHALLAAGGDDAEADGATATCPA
jgi:hypothetical protein